MIIFSEGLEISFLCTKVYGNALPVRNEGILPCKFLIKPLKNHRILKIVEMEKPGGNKYAFHKNKSTNLIVIEILSLRL